MTIDELNSKDRSGFVGAIGWVFEGSPWVAERAWDKRPFTTLDALHDALSSVVASAELGERTIAEIERDHLFVQPQWPHAHPRIQQDSRAGDGNR